MTKDESEMPIACQPCNMQQICDSDRLFLNCPHGDGLIEHKKHQSKTTRGGYREGSGRPETDRKHTVMARVSKEAKNIWDKIPNKSEWLDEHLKSM